LRHSGGWGRRGRGLLWRGYCAGRGDLVGSHPEIGVGLPEALEIEIGELPKLAGGELLGVRLVSGDEGEVGLPVVPALDDGRFSGGYGSLFVWGELVDVNVPADDVVLGRLVAHGVTALKGRWCPGVLEAS
jgi:hypothetical protein